MTDWLGLESARRKTTRADTPVDPVHDIPQEETMPAWTPDKYVGELDTILSTLGVEIPSTESPEINQSSSPAAGELPTNTGLPDGGFEGLPREGLLKTGSRELPQRPAYEAYMRYLKQPKPKGKWGAFQSERRLEQAREAQRENEFSTAAQLEAGRLRDENNFYRTDDISERDRGRMEATEAWRRTRDENTDRGQDYREKSGDRNFEANQAERERRAELAARKDTRANEMHNAKLKYLGAQLGRINRNMTKPPTDSKVSASEIKRASDLALTRLMNKNPELQQYGTNNFGTWSITNTPEVGSEDWDEYRNMIDEVEATQEELLGKRMSDFRGREKGAAPAVPSSGSAPRSLAPKKRVISPNGVAFQR